MKGIKRCNKSCYIISISYENKIQFLRRDDLHKFASSWILLAKPCHKYDKKLYESIHFLKRK